MLIAGVVTLGLLAFGFLCLVAQSVDVTQPQGPDNPFFRHLMYVYEEAIFMALLTRVRENDREGWET